MSAGDCTSAALQDARTHTDARACASAQMNAHMHTCGRGPDEQVCDGGWRNGRGEMPSMSQGGSHLDGLAALLLHLLVHNCARTDSTSTNRNCAEPTCAKASHLWTARCFRQVTRATYITKRCSNESMELAMHASHMRSTHQRICAR